MQTNITLNRVINLSPINFDMLICVFLDIRPDTGLSNLNPSRTTQIGYVACTMWEQWRSISRRNANCPSGLSHDLMNLNDFARKEKDSFKSGIIVIQRATDIFWRKKNKQREGDCGHGG